MSSGATDLESALQKQEEELRLLDMELENDAQEQPATNPENPVQ